MSSGAFQSRGSAPRSVRPDGAAASPPHDLRPAAETLDSFSHGSKSDLGAQSLTLFEAEVVALFADLVVLLGLPKSMGEIYGLVFASAEPATFVDIEHKLGLSKGSVSQGLRALRELGAVRDISQVDSALAIGLSSEAASLVVSQPPAAVLPRVARWVATTELRQLIGSLLRERLAPYLERQDQRMDAAKSALDKEVVRLSATNYKVLKSRFNKLKSWQNRAKNILPVLGRML